MLVQKVDASEEKPINQPRVEKFLKHLMIEERGLYTLLGSKPMTLFALVPIIDEVEKREIYASKTEQFRHYIPFEKFELEREDCRKLWNDWKAVQEQLLCKQFRIVEDDRTGGGVFINVPATIFILDKWKEDFSKITGITFNPFEAVYLIGDKTSPFWQKVQRNHYLMGLLLGYGERNAKSFQWEQEKKLQYPMRKGTSISPAHTGKPARELTLEDLDVPVFIIYQAIDERLEQFKLAREKGIELYKGKDFYELTVDLLKGIPLKEKERELSQESKMLLEQCKRHNWTFFTQIAL